MRMSDQHLSTPDTDGIKFFGFVWLAAEYVDEYVIEKRLVLDSITVWRAEESQELLGPDETSHTTPIPSCANV